MGEEGGVRKGVLLPHLRVDGVHVGGVRHDGVLDVAVDEVEGVVRVVGHGAVGHHSALQARHHLRGLPQKEVPRAHHRAAHHRHLLRNLKEDPFKPRLANTLGGKEYADDIHDYMRVIIHE
eukprot:1194564-Prorocentrum_minimum.AAC.1